jgi:hypothetical protein
LKSRRIYKKIIDERENYKESFPKFEGNCTLFIIYFLHFSKKRRLSINNIICFELRIISDKKSVLSLF